MATKKKKTIKRELLEILLLIVAVFAAMHLFNWLRGYTLPMGGGSVGVPGTSGAFGGWVGEEDELVFVVLPHQSLELSTGGGVSGSGRWFGSAITKTGSKWEYEVKGGWLSMRNGTADFGGQTFKLADGRVFILEEDFIVIQLTEEERVFARDKDSRKLLGEVYQNYLKSKGEGEN